MVGYGFNRRLGWINSGYLQKTYGFDLVFSSWQLDIRVILNLEYFYG